MIFDDICNWTSYFAHISAFNGIFHELTKITVETPNGKYRISDSCYYKVMSYDTKINPTIIESHRKEVDLQVILSGKENVKIFNAQSVEIATNYDEKSDCQFYKNYSQPEIEFKLIPGKMAVFFPQDIHACQFAVEEVETVKKIVFKIDEKLFTYQE